MISMDKAVHYCCVAKGGKIIQAYSGGDSEIENLAALCLESAPPYHRWYSQTMRKKTYCFLMEDEFVYFVIADNGLGNRRLLGFLEHVRNEFKRIAKKERGWGLNLKGSGNLNLNISSVSLQEQLVPVVRQLITSLQNVSQTGDHETVPPSSPSHCETDGYGELEGATSSKAPLLGKTTCKQEKNNKDHIIGLPMAMRGGELEENRRSADRGFRADSDSDNRGVAVTVSPTPLQKDMSRSMRMRLASQNAQKKWCRLLRLVLVIDAAVCIMLFLVWLVICQGLQCIR